MTIFAKVIADSILKPDYDNSPVSRITTMIVTFPRFILAEFNTHRMFSRNSASSRAIPFEKMLEVVQNNPFIPITWQKDHKGMQGTEYFTDHTIDENEYIWLVARDEAVFNAKCLHDQGVTKQLCNRLLEPFMWHTVICTFTEIENFFTLRCPQYVFGDKIFKSRKDYIKEVQSVDVSIKLSLWNDTDWLLINKGQSEIHMMALAEAMWDAYNESTPKELKAGEWHIPFGDDINKSLIFDIYKDGELTIHTKPLAGFSGTHDAVEKWYQEQCVKIATARCARVSYTVVGEENKSHNYENDIKLHDRLVSAGHWSPFEHCAKAMTNEEYYSFVKGEIPVQIDKYGITNLEMMPFSSGDPIVGFKGLNPTNGEKYGWCNNFRGFIQYRYLLENEK
jgi:hypothetical protein